LVTPKFQSYQCAESSKAVKRQLKNGKNSLAIFLCLTAVLCLLRNDKLDNNLNKWFVKRFYRWCSGKSGIAEAHMNRVIKHCFPNRRKLSSSQKICMARGLVR